MYDCRQAYEILQIKHIKTFCEMSVYASSNKFDDIAKLCVCHDI